MDSSKEIIKQTYFAAHMGGAYGQYENMKPSEQLVHVIRGLNGDYSKAEFEAVLRRFPKEIAVMDFENTKGTAMIRAVKPNDYFGSGQGGSTIGGTGAVPVLVVDTIMEGAMGELCAREACWTIPMQTELEPVPFMTARGYVPALAPNAEAYELMQNLCHATLRAKRHSVKASIGKELIKDSRLPIAAAIMKEAGGSMEATINQEALSTALENADSTEISVGSNPATATKGIFRAKAQVGKNGFKADTAITVPGYFGAMMEELVPAYNQAAQALSEGVGKLAYGKLNIYECGVALDSGISSKGIAYPSSGNYGAIVFDKMRVGCLGIREDMVAEEFDDPIKYLVAPVLTSRFAYVAAVDENKSSLSNKKAAVLLKAA